MSNIGNETWNILSKITFSFSSSPEFHFRFLDGTGDEVPLLVGGHDARRPDGLVAFKVGDAELVVPNPVDHVLHFRYGGEQAGPVHLQAAVLNAKPELHGEEVALRQKAK